jgi:uncharacterized protein (DUF433 family)
MTPTNYPHIVIKPSGTPMIEDTRISVARIALDHTHRQYPIKEIPKYYPGLTLGQVCMALAYYYDHKDESDRQIEEVDREFVAERAKWRAENPEMYARLMARRAEMHRAKA